MEKFSWKVPIDESGITLLSFLQRRIETASNRLLKQALDEGFCRVNGKYELFASKKIYAHDRVEMFSKWQDVIHEKRKSKKLPILFEDKDILIFNKPEGYLSEKTEKEVKNLFLVHRLDKKTSGAWLVAKHREAQKKWEDLFRKREIEKEYLAVVDGRVEKSSGHIKSYFIRKKSLQGQTIWGSSSTKRGEIAETKWNLVKSKKNYSILLLKPITGRTHQIRVHMKEMKHPILGDFLYEKKFSYLNFVSRMMLHSYKVSFLHPYTEKNVQITAPLPDEFLDFTGKRDLLPNRIPR